MNVEISKNPAVLYNASIPVTKLQLLRRSLYESASSLDLAKVIDAAGRNPDGVTGCSYRDGRVFYTQGGVEKEYLLSERITAVIEHGGWLTFPESYKFRIKYGKIVELAVHGGVLAAYQQLSKTDIPKHFGEPDYIDVFEQHGDPMDTTFVYHQRKLRVSHDDWNNKISMVNIGESLVWGEHGKLKGPWPVAD